MFIGGGYSCTENKDYEPGGTTPVEKLLTPQDKYFVELQSSSQATLKFSWEPARSEDGQPAHYEVVFFKNATSKDIVYRVDAGSKTSLDLIHKEINRAAGAAGVETGADGSIYWAVVSSRGITEAPVNIVPRELQLKRLLGFNVIPETIYITGDATEGGSDIANAYKAKSTSVDGGEFTIYHQLEAGKGFVFVSAKDGDKTTYTITNGSLDDQSTTSATVNESGIYKISLDFNIRAVSVEKVTEVLFNFAPRTADNRPMPYIGNGCWKMTDYKVEFRKESWGWDERYSFLATVGGKQFIWGSTTDSRPSEMTGSYYNIQEFEYTGDGYKNIFKFSGTLFDETAAIGKTVDITVNMSGDADFYHHLIDNIR